MDLIALYVYLISEMNTVQDEAKVHIEISFYIQGRKFDSRCYTVVYNNMKDFSLLLCISTRMVMIDDFSWKCSLQGDNVE